ncbi:MAG: hypothetical protein CVT94_14495 [Bacteroidetes bacterium HGW-Bacteroidetes-11]|nr:MAG: hypothetical protein CVT94_14495 [Bacteroidetes bacterium HGW-Bacteroidetes-11]
MIPLKFCKNNASHDAAKVKKKTKLVSIDESAANPENLPAAISQIIVAKRGHQSSKAPKNTKFRYYFFKRIFNFAK